MPKKNLIIHPFLFAIFPVLFLFAQNMGQVSSSSAFLPLMITLCFTLTCFIFLSSALKDREKAGIVTSLFLLLFFSYGYFFRMPAVIILVNFIAARLFIARDGIFLYLWLITFLLAAYFLIKTRIKLAKLTSILNVVSISLIIMSFISVWSFTLKTAGIRRHTKTSEGARAHFEGTGQGIGVFPDIYFIILDAYGNEGILEEFYGFRNNDFIDYLTEKGFYAAGKARSNYCQTSLTLSTSLNFVHFEDLKKYVSMETNDFEPLRRMIRHNNVFYRLKQYGYKIVAFYSGCNETEIKNADIYITPGYSLDAFHNLLMNCTPISGILNIIGMDNRFEVQRKKILFTLNKLARMDKYNFPVFVFAHIEAPHPPFVFGKHGEKAYKTFYDGIPFSNNDADWLIREGGFTKAQYVEAYKNQLLYINEKVKNAIDGILADSKNPPIIVLCGDHGPRSMLAWQDPDKTNFKECLSILNTYYFPNKDYEDLYDDITPINTFRVIFNRYFNASFELLDDRSCFSTQRYPYKLIDVTNEISSGGKKGVAGARTRNIQKITLNTELLNKLGEKR